MRQLSIELTILFLLLVVTLIVLSVLLNDPIGILSWAQGLIGLE